MTIYKCPRCHFETNFITVYRNHLSRKKVCRSKYSSEDPKTILDNLNELKKKCHTYQCEFCDEVFADPQRKYKHKRNCYAKKEAEDECIKSMQKQIDDLKELVSSQNQGKTVQYITINNNNNIQQQNNIENQNNIQISDFLKENIEYISDSFIRKCLKNTIGGVGDLAKQIHFNPEKPENHNVTATNKRDTFLEVFKEGKWQYADKNMTLDALIKRCFDVLSSHYDDYEDEIKAEMSSMRFKQVDQFVDSVSNNDKTIQSQLRKCLYLMIINNRHMVEKQK